MEADYQRVVGAEQASHATARRDEHALRAQDVLSVQPHVRDGRQAVEVEALVRMRRPGVVNRHSVPPVVRVEVSRPIESPHPRRPRGAPPRTGIGRARHPIRSERRRGRPGAARGSRAPPRACQAPFNASDPVEADRSR